MYNLTIFYIEDVALLTNIAPKAILRIEIRA